MNFMHRAAADADVLAYRFSYFLRGGTAAWRSLGGVLLCVTGCEALFAGEEAMLIFLVHLSGVLGHPYWQGRHVLPDSFAGLRDIPLAHGQPLPVLKLQSTFFPCCRHSFTSRARMWVNLRRCITAKAHCCLVLDMQKAPMLCRSSCTFAGFCADLGHFSRKSIQASFLFVCWPCLILTYLGQASLTFPWPQQVIEVIVTMRWRGSLTLVWV